jgi:hypothetical protein
MGFDQYGISTVQYNIVRYVFKLKRIIAECTNFFFFSEKGHIEAPKHFLKPKRLATTAVPLFSQSKHATHALIRANDFYIRVFPHIQKMDVFNSQLHQHMKFVCTKLKYVITVRFKITGSPSGRNRIKFRTETRPSSSPSLTHLKTRDKTKNTDTI